MDNISLKKKESKLQVIMMRATQEEGKFSSCEVIIRITDMFTCPAELQVPVALGNHWGHAGVC